MTRSITIADTPNFPGVAHWRVNNLAKEERRAAQLGCGKRRSAAAGLARRIPISYTYDTYMLATGTGMAFIRPVASWFF